MKKFTFVPLVLAILLLSSSLVCPTYGATGAAASAGLKFIEQSADDKEWEAIKEIVKKYEVGYVEAVNIGDFKIVEPYITPGSAFYTQQKNLVSSLFKKGTREKLMNYSIENTEFLKDKYKVYVVEEIEITTPGKAAKLNEYVWIYDINKTSKGLKIGAIAMWSDYKAYSDAASGRVKTDGYYIDDFGIYYGNLLTDAVNTLYIGRLKEICGNNYYQMEDQKRLITKMRGYGTEFELVRYINIEHKYAEGVLNASSYDNYYFKYKNKNAGESLLEIKIVFSLLEVRTGYTGYASLLGLETEKVESIDIPASGKTLQNFIPKGWKLFDKADGDLNKDGLADTAAVIEEDTGWKIGDYSNAPGRILIILLKQKDGSYKMALNTVNAVLKQDEGGIWGDPYGDISIKNGVLSLAFYGGSIDRWGNTYKFRCQNNGWFMIGATLHSLNTGSGEYTTKDFNLSTGMETITKGVEGGKSTLQNVNRGKKTLVNLKIFMAAAMSESVF